MTENFKWFIKSNKIKLLALLLLAFIPASSIGSLAQSNRLATSQPSVEPTIKVTKLKRAQTTPAQPTSKSIIAHEPNSVSVERLSGPDVFTTAVSVSQKYYDKGTPVAYIAERSAYSDSIIAGTMKQQGPLLYTKTSSLPGSIAKELNRLSPQTITIIGGKDIISAKVYQQIQSASPNSKVIRLSGTDRYSTAVDVSRSEYKNGASTVYVSNGSAYPDAIAATQQQAAGPLLYTKQNTAPSATIKEINRLGAKQVIIIGSKDVVSNNVASSIASRTSAKVKRIGGDDRYSTAANLSKQLYPNGIDQVYISEGSAYADSIIISSIPKPGALLYTRTNTIPSSTIDELYRLGADKVTIVGGDVRVSQAVETQVNQIARGAQLNDRITQGVSYFVSAHPDDELSAWAQIKESEYPVFVLATQGENSSYCTKNGGRGSQQCKDRRIDSFHKFLNNYYTVSNYGSQSGGFDLYKGSDSARLIFDLGDGKLTSAKISQAIDQARKVDYGISQENYVVSVNYWDSKRNPRCDADLSDLACGLYTHPDHYAVYQAVANYDFPNRLSAHGQYSGLSTAGMPIGNQLFKDILDCQDGTFNQAYAWLNPPCWTTQNSHWTSWNWVREY